MSEAAEARRALGELVAGDEPQIDLPRAALLIAHEEYPQLDTAAYLAQLDHLGAIARERIAHERVPERQVAALNVLLFGEEGFRGNTGDYYDPRNSYLNEVLDRRLGIPITLSLVYLEVARRAGLSLVGVGFPAHFLVAFEAAPRLLVDPFNCGRVLTAEDCERLLVNMSGRSARLEDKHLEAIAPRAFLVRMITNLKVAYERAGNLRRAIRASEQLLLVMPDAEAVRRQLASMRELHARRN